MLSGGPEGLHGVLGRAVADQADDRPGDAPVAVSQRDPDRGRGCPSHSPPLAVAKNDPVLTVGSHSICWAMVEVDSLTMTESGGLTRLSTA